MQAELRTQTSSLLHLEWIAAEQGAQTNQALVLIHGWGNSSQIWQPLIPFLSRERDLLLIDLPACGKNNFTDTFTLEELLHAIETSLPPACVVVGWSLGGMLAARLAANANNKIYALVTLATNPCFVAEAAWPWAMEESTYQKFLEGFQLNPQAIYKRFTALQVLGDADRKSTLAKIELYGNTPQETQQATWQCLLELLKSLKNIDQVPACSGLHLFADNDALVPVEVAEKAYQNIPRQQRDVLTNCGHAFLLSKTQELAERIFRFLENIEAQAQSRENKRRIVQAFSQAATSYDATAKLQRLIAEKLVTMSSLEKTETDLVVDLGCGTGFIGELLQRKNKNISLVHSDLSQSMLNQAREKFSELFEQENTEQIYLAADMDSLPFAAGTIDVFLSSMSLQWSSNTEELFAQIYTSLKPGGKLIFSTVGEGTLIELAAAWREVDAYTHVNAFLNEETIRALAEKQNFICEQTCSESHTQYFEDVVQLMKSLKAVGAHTVNAGHMHGLTSRARLRTLQQAYEQFRGDKQLLPASWKIHYFVLRK